MKKNDGFTLIDTALILTVAGLVITPVLGLYSEKVKTEKENLKVSRVISIKEGLVKYALRNGAYPVPANPTRNIDTNADHGDPVATWPVYSGGNCAAGAPAVNGVICRPGNRNIAGGGTAFNHAYETVLIGALPVSAIGLTAEDALDSYGRKYLYAVSTALTNSATFDDDRGVIQIQSNGSTTNDIQNTDKEVHFVVLSMGENGEGGYTATGTQLPCVIDGEIEDENCDGNDSIFTALGDTSDNYVKEYNLLEDANYFDDIIQYETTIMGRFWTPTDAGFVNMTSGSDQISRVSIGYEAGYVPIASLDISGDVRTDDAITNRLCNAARSECFTVENIIDDSVSSATYLKCGSFGLKQINAINKTSSTNAINAQASGVCDTETKVASGTSLGTEDTDGTICANGSYGLDVNGELLCR